MISLFYILLISLTSLCNGHKPKYESFTECLSNYSGVHFQVYAPDTLSYLHLLQYAEKNRRWFNSKSRRPFAITTPKKPADIRPVVLCSKKLGLQVRVKSGGHDYEGLSFRSTMTPFVMVDLTNMNGIEVDLDEKTAWIETGVTIGQLYYEIGLKSKILGFPAGLYPGVGSGGHISGGGLGTMLRKYGLASDHVIDAMIMDSNGTICNRKEMGEDLFWAIRGGGAASFGIVLAWKLKLVHVPKKVTSFSVRRKMEPNNLKLLQKWHNSAYKLPKNLFIRVLLAIRQENPPKQGKYVQVQYNGLYLGKAKKLVKLLKKNFPEFGLEIKDCLGKHTFDPKCPDMPCIKKDCVQAPWIESVLYFAILIKVQQLKDQRNNSSSYEKGTSDFLTTTIPNKGWRMLYDMLLDQPSPYIILDPFGGKMDEIDENKSPFPHRNGTLYSVQYITQWRTDNETDAMIHLKWIRKLYRKMTPYVTKNPRTAYLNYKDLGFGQNDAMFSYESSKVWGEKYFKGNFERLARVKGRVDPENFFKNEQSIPILT